VLNYLNPIERCESDGIRYSINKKINIANVWEINNDINIIPHPYFSSIRSNINADIDFTYKSYRCNGNIDTIKYEYNKCLSDSNFSYSSKFIFNPKKNFLCGDTIHYIHELIAKRIDNKVVNWLAKKDTIISFPLNKYEKPIYFNGIFVSNSDSSCPTYIQSPRMNVMCTYCMNPAKKINGFISVDKSRYNCTDTIRFKANILGGDSVKIFLWKSDTFQKVTYPSDPNANKNYFNSLQIMNSKDSSCSITLSKNLDSVFCIYCENPLKNSKITLEIYSDTIFKEDTIRYTLFSSEISDSLWCSPTPKPDKLFPGLNRVKFVFGNQYCVRDSFYRNVFVKSKSSSYNSGDNFKFLLYPNPANNSLYITTSCQKEKKYTIKIINYLGNNLAYITAQDGNIEFSTKDISNGLYSIVLEDENNSVIYSTKLHIHHEK
jgi:hypothetical protein